MSSAVTEHNTTVSPSVNDSHRGGQETPGRLPAVGAVIPGGRVLGVRPPDRYVLLDLRYGSPPAVMTEMPPSRTAGPVGWIRSTPLGAGVWSSPAGLTFWVRRSKAGRWYASVLAGGAWHYTGQQAFANAFDWEHLGDTPWCKHWRRTSRCGAMLTTIAEFRAGRCAPCAWVFEHGEPDHPDLRTVACPKCTVGPHQACRDEDGVAFDGHHRARRDVFLAGQVEKGREAGT
jgi:hypothetical protein